ncbi:ScbR family autoregulator-binding transcription factor [Actinopolyspora halophila]|uniref:ScbR family autoregulator-binding transcription factor n=1 Tax=Actinopolyspora halophila TaxID=1850 RepID=UPI000373FEEA|nr:ScbR family autoregulator-binding transcription factor [Actinopolyspora halophila]
MVKQERAARTRASVLRAGAEVIAARGYEGATIAEILEHAGVTKGAMYFHFPSKQALAQAVIEEQTNVRVEQGGVSRLQDAVDFSHKVGVALRDDPLFQAGTRIAVETGFGQDPMVPYQDWSELFRGVFSEAQHAGELLPTIDPGETAELFVASYLGTQLFSQASTNRADISGWVARLWQHLLPGMAAPGVLARIDPHGRAVSASVEAV